MPQEVRQLRLVVEAVDYDEALVFYRDALGMTEQESYAGDGGARVVILDAGRATLELANPAQKQMIDDVEVGHQVAGPIRVALEVDDARASAVRLAAAGADLVAPPTRTPWDSLNARLDGPAGLHLTIFTEEPEPVLAPDYPLLTDRLLLRPIDPTGDVDAIHAYRSREDVCRYVPFEPTTRVEQGRRLASARHTGSILRKPGQSIALAVVRRDTGALIGDVQLFWHSDTHRSGEIGYLLHPDHSGNGYASEAAEALLALAFEGLRLHRVTARIDARNLGSAGVARRLGMRQEAVLIDNEWFKGEWSTEVVFAILEHEWRDRACSTDR